MGIGICIDIDIDFDIGIGRSTCMCVGVGFGIGIERYIDLFAYPEEVGKLADFDHFGVKASLVAIL